MTDRLKGVWVAFERDIRTDDVEPLIEAIKCLRGVLAVEPSIATLYPPDAFCDEWIAIANEAEKLRVALEDWRWGKCEDCGAQLRGATATPGGLDSHRCSACYGKKYYPKEKQ